MKPNAKFAASMMSVLAIAMLAVPGYLTFTNELELSTWQVISPLFAMFFASGIGAAIRRSVEMTAILLGLSLSILVSSMFSENIAAIGVAFAGVCIGISVGGYLVSVIVESEEERSQKHLRLVK